MSSLLNDKKSNMIYSLQAWRGIMILMIFILHVCSKKIPFLAGGYETISYFIVLSGFVATLSNKNKKKTSIKNIKDYYFRKISKFYPLHILTALACLLLYSLPMIIKHVYSGMKLMVMPFVTNALLIQSFVPDENYYYSFNGVAWYLSATAFFYIVFIPLYNFYEKMSSKNLIVFFTINLVVFCALVFALQGMPNYDYYTYIFPPFRCLEFANGIILGLIFLRKKDDLKECNSVSFTIIEILAILAFVADRYICTKTQLFSGSHNFKAITGMLIAILIVFAFAFEKGFVTKAISNKVLVFFGNISFEFFIIHMVIMKYYDTLSDYFGITICREVIIFVLSLVIASVIHFKLYKKLFNKHK